MQNKWRGRMTENPRPRTQADVVLEPVSYFTRRTLLSAPSRGGQALLAFLRVLL